MSPEKTKPTTGFVVLTLAVHQEGRRWVGKCLELGTATDGPTLGQVHIELVELLELHLSTLDKIGEFQRFSEENSIKLYRNALPPREITQTLPVSEEHFLHAHVFPLDRAA